MGKLTNAAAGARARFHLGQESTFGNFVKPTHRIEHLSESLGSTENVLESEGINGFRDRNDVLPGTFDVGGDMEFELGPEGAGIIYYNALGDYIRVDRCDGGFHARIASADVIDEIPVVGTNLIRYVHEFLQETPIRFPQEGEPGYTTLDPAIAYVFRNNGALTLVDLDGGNPIRYQRSNARVVSYIQALGVSDTTSPNSAAPALRVRIEQVTDQLGLPVNPPLATEGIAYVGPNRVRVRYYQADTTPSAGNGTDIWLLAADWAADNATALPADALAVGDVIIIAPSISRETSTFPVIPGMNKGAWVLRKLDAANFPGDEYEIYTHFIDGGRTQPAGLTLEADKDAAVLTLSGQKIGQLVTNFEQQAIMTASASFMGRREYAAAVLAEDVAPDAASILLNEADQFRQLVPAYALGVQVDLPVPATITIKNETDIQVNSLMVNADGTVRLYVNQLADDATGATTIERLHLRNENVDLRSTLAHQNLGSRQYTITIGGTSANLQEYNAEIGGRAYQHIADGADTNTTNADALAALIAEDFEVISAENAGAVITVVLAYGSSAEVTSSATGTGTAVTALTVDFAVEGVIDTTVGALVQHQTLIYIDGEIEEVLSSSLTIANTMEEGKYVHGDRYRAELPEQSRDIDASLNAEFDNLANHTKFKRGTKFALEWRCAQPIEQSCEGVDLTGIPNQAYFFCPRCRYTGSTPAIEGRDSMVTHDLPVMAMIDKCYDASALTVLFVNRSRYDVQAPD